MESLDELTKLCNVKLHVITSFIRHPDPKAVSYNLLDLINPNHYTGHALSLHIYDTKDKLLCNDECLGSKFTDFILIIMLGLT